MIRHSTVKAVVDKRIGDFDSSSKDLLQMPPMIMSDSVRVECTGEVEEVHVVDVVIL